MERIRFNYRFIIGFNAALIALGVTGVLTPSTSALLHNGSTVATGLRSMGDLLPESRLADPKAAWKKTLPAEGKKEQPAESEVYAG